MKQKLSNLWGKDGTKSVLASLISILIGMVVGALIIIIVGAANPSLGLNSAWEGIRLVFGGLFSTGRDAAGTLTFGFKMCIRDSPHPARRSSADRSAAAARRRSGWGHP